MAARSVLLFALATALTAQTPPGAAVQPGAYIRAAGTQGSVLLTKGGKIILAKGYGLANVELGVPNLPKRKFVLVRSRTSSAPRSHSSALGETRHRRPDLEVHPGAPAAWSGIAIRHLLTHASGIPSYTDQAGYQARMRERPDLRSISSTVFGASRSNFGPAKNSTTITRAISFGRHYRAGFRPEVRR